MPTTIEVNGGSRKVRTPSPAEGADLAAPFVAIDFETADQGRDSACAVALVRVDRGRITARESRRIRPPRRDFEFTWVHGLRWEDVAAAPPFPDVWRELAPLLDGASFLAAHNAGFDRSVLAAGCAAARLAVPSQPFECTVRLARRVWSLYPTRLPDVCAHLRIPLRHHDPLSDAEACARIVLAARDAAVRPSTRAPTPRRPAQPTSR